MQKGASRLLWWIGLGSALALLVAYGILGSVQSQREALLVGTESSLERLRGIATLRPVLRGAPLPEPAWDHYRSALQQWHDDVPVGECAATLQRGASCADATRLEEWSALEGEPSVDLLACVDLARAVTAHAESLVAAGELVVAAQLAMDVAMFGRDVGSTGTLLGQMVGVTIIDGALDVLHGEGARRPLPRPICRSVAGELRVLDRCLPPEWLPYRWEAVAASSILLHGRLSFARPDGVTGWFYDRGVALLAPDAVGRFRREMAEVELATAMPWRDARAAVERVRADARGSINPLSRLLFVPDERCLMEPRRVRARVRMLRTALHFRASGEVLELRDPFGSAMHFEARDDSLRAWSAGPDGVGDLVLEIQA